MNALFPGEADHLPFGAGTGEVRAPGGYAVLRPRERLSDHPRAIFRDPEAAAVVALIVRLRTPS